MIAEEYVAKISPQGQITIPKSLKGRLKLTNGSRVVLRPNDNGDLVIGGKFPVEKFFGTLGDLTGGVDAAEYVRKMRDEESSDREHKVRL